jgi:MATE family multidrug resistance protein
MGVTGAGLATLLARIAIALGMIALLLADRTVAEWAAGWWRGLPAREDIWRLVRFGAPVGALHLLEVGAFVLSGLMLGWISAEALAAHQIAIVCAATTFTFALGLAMAVGIRVGHAWGRGDIPALRRTGFSAMASSALVMGGFAVTFLTLRHGIIGVFAPDAAVASLAASLLVVAAMFQLFDGQQVVAIFALRGVGDVRVPAWGAVLAYWLVALPVGYTLAFIAKLGAPGMWMGLALGLGVLAVGLGVRFSVLTRRTVPSSEPVHGSAA